MRADLRVTLKEVGLVAGQSVQGVREGFGLGSCVLIETRTVQCSGNPIYRG